MLNNLLDIIDSNTIYLLANWGVWPLAIINFCTKSRSDHFFAQSIIAPLLLALGYIFCSYNLQGRY